MREGLLLYAKSGALPQQVLEDLVGRARALDMDEVRRKRAARGKTA